MQITQPTFKFNLGQPVQINVSGEQGQVRARSDSIEGANQYRIAYRNALGVAAEAWWSEDQLAVAEQKNALQPAGAALTSANNTWGMTADGTIQVHSQPTIK